MKKTLCKLKDNSVLSTMILSIIFSISVLQVFYIEAMFTAKQLPYRSFRGSNVSSSAIVTKLKMRQKRRLLIFLDDEETNTIGPVGSDLLVALYEEASPIIVSSSLMGTILEKRKSDNRSTRTIMDQLSLASNYYVDRLKEIENDMRERNEIVKKSINIKEDNDILACKEGFKPDQWIIKKINNHLLLLIPYKYCTFIGVDREKVKEDNHVRDKLSYEELLLGLKVNHLKTIEYTEISISLRSHLISYLGGIFVNYFVPFLNNIFCTKSNYKNQKTVKDISVPEWTIYIIGHGMINEAIAYLSLHNFKKLLIFFEEGIRIQLLYIVSCYVAGTNIKKIYQDAKLETKQCCSFPIIVQGLGNAVTYGSWVTGNILTWLAERRLDLSAKKSFSYFFKLANEKEGKYSAIIRPLQGYFEEIANTPQIKLPNIEWFSVLDSINNVASIGSILAKTRDPQEPLNIDSFFRQKHLKAILLYAENIPFELIINSNSLADIVPMTSGLMSKSDSERIIYRIKKISSTKYDLPKILSLFKSVVSTGGGKWVFIDEINSKTGIAQDILIDGHWEEGMNAYYKKDDILYKFNTHVNNTVKIEKGSYDEYQYNEGMYIVGHQYSKSFENKPGAEEEITSEQIKKLERALKKTPEKVLESRRQVEEEVRRARQQTLIE